MAARTLILALFINRVGNGLFNSVSVLYFTLIVHLPAAEVGAGLTIAGLIGLVTAVPAGTLADHVGPRTVMIAALGTQAATMVAYVFIRDWLAFTAVATVGQLAAAAGSGAGGALIARVAGERRAEFLPRLRNWNNIGVIVGTVGAGFAVQAGSTAAYTTLVVADAASFAGCALLLLRLPRYAPLPRPDGGSRWAALTDRPYLVVTALHGAMGLQYPVAGLLLPLWIAMHTRAPHWTVAAVAALNGAVCVLFQQRLGRRVDTPERGGRALRTAGLLFLLSCPLMAATADVPAWPAVVLVVAAIAVHSLGEVQESSAGFALGYGLAPAHAQGQYQGLLGLGFGLGQALAPALLTTVVLDLGQAGWLLLAVLFAAVGTAGPPVARWAAESRPVSA